MWGGKKYKVDRIDTLVGRNTELNGDIAFRGGLHIDGVVRGNVVGDPQGSVLTVSESGLIEGEVHVPNVILNGCVTGDVHTRERIELAAQARVQGNVYYNLLEMAMGAEVNGSLVHEPPEAEAELARELTAEEAANT